MANVSTSIIARGGAESSAHDPKDTIPKCSSFYTVKVRQPSFGRSGARDYVHRTKYFRPDGQPNDIGVIGSSNEGKLYYAYLTLNLYKPHGRAVSCQVSHISWLVALIRVMSRTRYTGAFGLYP